MNNVDAKILKKMIREMIDRKISEECGSDPSVQVIQPPSQVDSQEVDPDQYEGEMAKGNLFTAAKAATSLHNLFSDNENLEPWVEEKIAIASNMLKTVADYIEYQKYKGGR